MTRLALALAVMMTLPAHAGDTAPGPMAALVPQVWQSSVFEVTCGDLGDCCGLHRECGDWYVQDHGTPDPAPVPLPGAGLMLVAALGLLWRMR